MKKILLPVIVFMSMNSFANEKGNGGISYVCRDDQNKITHARLLDLWEPETFSPHQDDSKTVETQFEEVMARIARLDKKTANQIVEADKRLTKITIETQKSLPLTNDALPDFVPESGCKFEQVARYGFSNEHNSDRLRISKEIYTNKAFSNTDRAALRLHEALYLLDSERNGAVFSLKTRRLVSRLFSTTELSFELKEELIELVESNNKFTRLKLYSRGPETTIRITGKLTVEECGKGRYVYGISDSNKEIIATGSASGRNYRSIFTQKGNYLNDFKDQDVTLKAGSKILFGIKRDASLSAVFKIYDEVGRHISPLFVSLNGWPREMIVEIVDISK